MHEFSIQEKIEEASRANRQLDDGIYDISDVEFIKFREGQENDEEAKAFIRKYPEFWIGSAYETYTAILLSKYPKKFTGKEIGSGFNYGSTNVLTDLPDSILILAQND